MKKFLTIATCFSAMSTPALAQAPAQPSQAPAEQSSNAALLAGEKLVAALQSDMAARRAFTETVFSTSALAKESAAQRAAGLEQLVAASGGLSLDRTYVRADRHVDLILATENGRFLTAVVFTSSKEPGKISGLFFMPARDPVKVQKEQWPDKAVPLVRLPDEIGWRAAEQAKDNFFYGAVLVAKGDRVLFRQAYGPANRSARVLNAPDTLFQSASVGKMFTAAAILKLVEQVNLSLDDSLAKWVPEYPDKVAADKIKLRHLLTHTAGLAEWERQFEIHASQRTAAKTMTAPLASEPGARMSYSNAGYVLLGAVLEAVTGRSLEDATRSLVFRPAGMKRTTFKPAMQVKRSATRYVHADDDPVGFRGYIAYTKDDHLAADGSGGAYTTVDDLFAFHRALVKGRLLSRPLTAEILSPKVDFPGAPRPSKYGYGQRFGECSGRPVLGHSGGGANAGISNATYATVDGEWTVIVLSNSNSAGEELAISICEAVAKI